MTLKRTGNSIYLSNGTKLLIAKRTRKAQTRSKTETYLLKIDETGKRHYISSLWGNPPEYEFEYKGTRYSLVLLSPDHVTLKAILRPQGVTE